MTPHPHPLLRANGDAADARVNGSRESASGCPTVRGILRSPLQRRTAPAAAKDVLRYVLLLLRRSNCHTVLFMHSVLLPEMHLSLLRLLRLGLLFLRN